MYKQHTWVSKEIYELFEVAKIELFAYAKTEKKQTRLTTRAIGYNVMEKDLD